MQSTAESGCLPTLSIVQLSHTWMLGSTYGKVGGLGQGKSEMCEWNRESWEY